MALTGARFAGFWRTFPGSRILRIVTATEMCGRAVLAADRAGNTRPSSAGACSARTRQPGWRGVKREDPLILDYFGLRSVRCHAAIGDMG